MSGSQTEWKPLQMLIGKRMKGWTASTLGALYLNQPRKSEKWEWCGCGDSKGHETTDGLRTAGAPGNQLAGTGDQRIEFRPA